jgi:hypothetical protein
MERHLKSGSFRIFYNIFWATLKGGVAVSLIHYWEYGVYVVIAYIFYVLEDLSFLQFRAV